MENIGVLTKCHGDGFCKKRRSHGDGDRYEKSKMSQIGTTSKESD